MDYDFEQFVDIFDFVLYVNNVEYDFNIVFNFYDVIYE
jgi:hypothetical protein